MGTKYGGRTGYETQKNVRSGIGPVGAFFLTLTSVVFIGGIIVAFLALPKYLRLHHNEPVSIVTFVEAIPETLATVEEEPEVLGANAVKEKYADIIKDPELLKQSGIYTKTAASKDVVTLGFVGDILFDDEYAVTATLKSRGGMLSSAISPETLAYMQSMDIMVVNNEFPYTERGTRCEGKTYTFRADYNTVNYLHEMGADVAILANNHVLDFGQEGLNDTLDTLTNAGIPYVGAGRNIDEASSPVYFIVNDIKIAIVAATQIERNDHPNTTGATETNGGTFRCWTGDLIYQKVAEAKANSDFVIVCVHWGTEKETSPDGYQLKQGPLLAQAGADVIIGDHPHVLQGITYFDNTPCIYSLGNFWFNSSTLDTGMVQLEVTKDGLKSFKFIPGIQSKCQTAFVGGADASRIIGRMRNMSSGVIIDDNGYVYKK
ncbi:MAG: CapA family protein [Lachnospiraceae bacterium]|nr:CapA family protein [Lachnospiraceae bacterium]